MNLFDLLSALAWAWPVVLVLGGVGYLAACAGAGRWLTPREWL